MTRRSFHGLPGLTVAPGERLVVTADGWFEARDTRGKARRLGPVTMGTWHRIDIVPRRRPGNWWYNRPVLDAVTVAALAGARVLLRVARKTADIADDQARWPKIDRALRALTGRHLSVPAPTGDFYIDDYREVDGMPGPGDVPDRGTWP